MHDRNPARKALKGKPPTITQYCRGIGKRANGKYI